MRPCWTAAAWAWPVPRPTLCCYIGQQAQVKQALQELELRAEKDRCRGQGLYG